MEIGDGVYRIERHAYVKKLINKYIMKLKNTAGITKNSKKSANT